MPMRINERASLDSGEVKTGMLAIDSVELGA